MPSTTIQTQRGTVVVVESCPHRERPVEAVIAEVAGENGDGPRWKVKTAYPDGCGGLKIVDFRPDRVLHAGGGEVEHRYQMRI